MRMEERGIIWRKTRTGNFYYGLQMRPDWF